MTVAELNAKAKRELLAEMWTVIHAAKVEWNAAASDDSKALAIGAVWTAGLNNAITTREVEHLTNWVRGWKVKRPRKS